MRPDSGDVRIGLVGDFDPTVMAHQAVPVALELAAYTRMPLELNVASALRRRPMIVA